MEIIKIPYQQIPQFSHKDVAYATGHPNLRPFFKYEVHLDAFEQVIRDKSKDPINREVLVEVLREQYEKIPCSDIVSQQIDKLLLPNTFTITTAHQPSLCTGPLYYIYKIASTIHLTHHLNEKYPGCHFVPVFVMGSEDHDFEEVNHFNLFNKTITWTNDEKGAVGMMSSNNLKPILEELKPILGESENAKKIYGIIEEAYTSHPKYGDGALHLTSELFRSYGLVVLGMNHPKLKHLFKSFIEKEILEQPSKSLVDQTTLQLENAGFSGQAHARDINFFYLTDQIRERIVLENGRYQVLNTSISFSAAEMKSEIQEHPERFSPNVVMRPLYQECVLPNLAYIGGGGEIAYWLERKSQFGYFGLNFPMLIRRNSVLWIDNATSKRMEKLGLSIYDLLEDTDSVIKHYVKSNTENEISLSEELVMMDNLFDHVIQKAEDIDPTLAKSFVAEKVKQVKNLEQIEGKLMRAEKQKHETAINQIRSLKEKLFPGNGLQERFDNFLPFYIKYGPSFFEELIKVLNPLEQGMIVFQE